MGPGVLKPCRVGVGVGDGPAGDGEGRVVRTGETDGVAGAPCRGDPRLGRRSLRTPVAHTAATDPTRTTTTTMATNGTCTGAACLGRWKRGGMFGWRCYRL